MSQVRGRPNGSAIRPHLLITVLEQLQISPWRPLSLPWESIAGTEILRAYVASCAPAGCNVRTKDWRVSQTSLLCAMTLLLGTICIQASSASRLLASCQRSSQLEKQGIAQKC
eukprot:3498267-Amphidinium_carterae.2